MWQCSMPTLVDVIWYLSSMMMLSSTNYIRGSSHCASVALQTNGCGGFWWLLFVTVHQ